MKKEEITKIEDKGDGVIYVEFKRVKKKGNFTYDFLGNRELEEPAGISACSYNEDDREDIFYEIHNFVDRHFKFKKKAKIEIIGFKDNELFLLGLK